MGVNMLENLAAAEVPSQLPPSISTPIELHPSGTLPWRGKFGMRINHSAATEYALPLDPADALIPKGTPAIFETADKRTEAKKLEFYKPAMTSLERLDAMKPICNQYAPRGLRYGDDDPAQHRYDVPQPERPQAPRRKSPNPNRRQKKSRIMSAFF